MIQWLNYNSLQIQKKFQEWKQKLEEFEDILAQVISWGIPSVEKYNVDILRKKFKEQNCNQSSLKIKQLVANFIEGQSGSQNLKYLAFQCQMWLAEQFQIKAYSEREIITTIDEVSKKVNYKMKEFKYIKKTKEHFKIEWIYQFKKDNVPKELKQLEFKSLDHEIYEIKNEKEIIELISSNEDFQRNRLIRNYLGKWIKSLEKLIINIRNLSSQEKLEEMEKKLQLVESSYKKYFENRNIKLNLLVKNEPEKIIKFQSLPQEQRLLIPWQNRLKEFENQLENILSWGIPKLDRTVNEMQAEKIKINLRQCTSKTFINDLIRIIAIEIEGKPGNISLIELSTQITSFIQNTIKLKYELNSIAEIIAPIYQQKQYFDIKERQIKYTLKESFSLEDLINYSGLQFSERFEKKQFKIIQHNVLEIKEQSSLDLFCHTDEFKQNRLIRKYLASQIKDLNKLIQLIKFAKIESDLFLIEQQYSQFVQGKKNLKLDFNKFKKLEVKIEQKTIPKGRRGKKQMIEDKNQSKITQFFTKNSKDLIKKEEYDIFPIKQEDNQTQVRTINQEYQPKTTKNQETQQMQEEKKILNLLRSIQSKQSISDWNSERERAFNKVLQQQIQIDFNVIKFDIKRKIEIHNKKWKKNQIRKPYINIFDQKYIFSAPIDYKTQITGKNPFFQDEDAVFYEHDSNEEIELMLAESIENSINKMDDESNDVIWDSEENFINDLELNVTNDENISQKQPYQLVSKNMKTAEFYKYHIERIQQTTSFPLKCSYQKKSKVIEPIQVMQENQNFESRNSQNKQQSIDPIQNAQKKRKIMLINLEDLAQDYEMVEIKDYPKKKSKIKIID